MTFSVHADAWLSEVMARRVFRVDGSGATSELATHIERSTIADQVEPEASARSPQSAFYFAKVPTDKVSDVAALTRSGFTVVDTNVTFELAREVEVVHELEVGDLRETEVDAVLDIAATAFRFSRFHLDPLIGGELANHIKREWVRNYVLRKRGAGLLVARRGERPIGFLAHLVSRGQAVIDLIAVARDVQGNRAGAALTAAFVSLYRGMPRMVGTQVANVPSIRLYNKLGFAFARSQYVLHHHANR